jgi:hypothetical protein
VPGSVLPDARKMFSLTKWQSISIGEKVNSGGYLTTVT